MAENSYRMYSETGETSGWNMEVIADQMPHVYLKSRSKVTGSRVFKSRIFPGYITTRGVTKWEKAFQRQDKLREEFRTIEKDGHMPRLVMLCTFGDIVLNYDLAEFFILTSEIANLHVVGWNFRVE